MYVYDGGLGANVDSTLLRLVTTAIGTGEAAFTWWNISQPIVALPGSSLQDVIDAYAATRGATSVTQKQALQQVLLPADDMTPDAACTYLTDEAALRGRTLALRLKRVILWALPTSNPAQVYAAWNQTKLRVEEYGILNVELPQPHIGPAGTTLNGGDAAITLFWNAWEAGASLAQGHFGDLILRATPKTSLDDLIRQAQKRKRP